MVNIGHHFPTWCVTALTSYIFGSISSCMQTICSLCIEIFLNLLLLFLLRFNASEILNRGRNGRVVFAGDSVGRNQWESFLCMLAQGVPNKSSIYEENGKPITKHKGFLSMRFSEYNLTVEYYRAPFLVFIGRPPRNSPAGIKMTIKVDQLHWFARNWEGADVLMFNTGHWWNEDKTVKMYEIFSLILQFLFIADHKVTLTIWYVQG